MKHWAGGHSKGQKTVILRTVETCHVFATGTCLRVCGCQFASFSASSSSLPPACALPSFSPLFGLIFFSQGREGGRKEGGRPIHAVRAQSPHKNSRGEVGGNSLEVQGAMFTRLHLVVLLQEVRLAWWGFQETRYDLSLELQTSTHFLIVLAKPATSP